MSKNLHFDLPALDYKYEDLEPHIDAKTMEIHHTKHHAGYINKLNSALGMSDLHFESLEDIVRNLDKDRAGDFYWDLRNNAGGHYNHSLFFKMMSPNGGGEPGGLLLRKIEEDFGGFEEFKKKFTKASLSRFGSGFVWLLMDEERKLFIKSAPNQDCPIGRSKHAVLCLDVWEHAYYLKYNNRRVDYTNAWWNVVNWKYVEERFEELYSS